MRARLRTLSKENAENVGLHLVMTGRLLDSDPELAYEHAQAAVRRAGRVDVVREAAGLAAYRTGRFAEALRELRTVRRLNGSSEHLAVMADCERGLGRPERALALASSPEAESLAPAETVELAIVVSGARLDLGEPEAAIAVLQAPAVRAASGVVAVRVAQALSAAYEAAGRGDDARDVLAGYTQTQLDEASGGADDEEDVVVFDLDEDEDQDGDELGLGGSDLGEDEPGPGGSDRGEREQTLDGRGLDEQEHGLDGRGRDEHRLDERVLEEGERELGGSEPDRARHTSAHDADAPIEVAGSAAAPQGSPDDGAGDGADERERADDADGAGEADGADGADGGDKREGDA